MHGAPQPIRPRWRAGHLCRGGSWGAMVACWVYSDSGRAQIGNRNLFNVQTKRRLESSITSSVSNHPIALAITIVTSAAAT